MPRYSAAIRLWLLFVPFNESVCWSEFVMSTHQTPSAHSAKRQNRAAKRNWSAKKALNISRKILEKSVIQQNARIGSIQQNNIQLARRVSELQKELSERTAELQVSREESFQLRLKLNRLQNNSVESALHSLRERLASVTEEMFNIHEFAARVCSELSLPDVSPCPRDTPFSRGSDGFVPMECTVTVLPGEEEAVRISNDVTLGSSVQSVEMELDSFDVTANPFVGYPTGRKTLALPVSNEKVVGTPPFPFQTGGSSLANLQNRGSDSPTPLQIGKSSPPTQLTSSCPNEDETYVPKPERKRIPPIKKAKKISGAVGTVAASETTESAPSEPVDPLDLPSDREPTESHPPSASVLAIASLNQLAMELKHGKEESEEKVEEVVLLEPKDPPRRQSRRRRKRLRLIADDSVFIPISDSMVEDAISGSKRNVSKTASLPNSVVTKQRDDRVEEKAVIKSSTSQVQKDINDTPSSPIRTRRKHDPVSYVVKLNTKLRQGDQNWCRN
ncbi:hypothetical protein TcWFU_000321 [Taenia crassiceps]|uniref:Shugoshin C-terminal domain-containing protein n=1 Tax=Taenia crassiceps TaxID=6207 RepID=A0ABR4Q606_9CEST